MKPIRSLMINALSIILCMFFYGALAQDNVNISEPDIQVKNYVDKTALFPGDHINYVVEIICSTEIDILLEDLDEDELILSGLELVSSSYQHESDENGTRYRFNYTLSTYETSSISLKIDELRVRYYFKRPGQRIEDIATVGEVTIPVVDLSLRSTLTGELEGLQLRDIQSAGVITSWLDHAGILGLIIVLLSVFPVGSSVFAYIHKRNQESQVQQAKETLQVSASQFDTLRDLDANEVSNRRQGFWQLETIIRDYVEKTTGLVAQSLTANDLSQQNAVFDSENSLNDIVEILNLCEHARYGRDENLPSSEQFFQGIQQVEALITQS